MAHKAAPEVDHLLSKLHQFRERTVTLDELQASLWGTAQALTAREDRWLREQLQDAEGRVELIRFTKEEALIWDEVLNIVESVEIALKDETNGTRVQSN